MNSDWITYHGYEYQVKEPLETLSTITSSTPPYVSFRVEVREVGKEAPFTVYELQCDKSLKAGDGSRMPGLKTFLTRDEQEFNRQAISWLDSVREKGPLWARGLIDLGWVGPPTKELVEFTSQKPRPRARDWSEWELQYLLCAAFERRKQDTLNYRKDGIDVAGVGTVLGLEVTEVEGKVEVKEVQRVIDDLLGDGAIAAESHDDAMQGRAWFVRQPSLVGAAFEGFDELLRQKFDKAVSSLSRATEGAAEERPDGDWSGVAHDCEEALKHLASAIWKQKDAQQLKEAVPSKTDYERLLSQTIRARLAGDRNEALRKLLEALEDYVARLEVYLKARRHDPSTSQLEAKRLVILTYVLLAEIARFA